MYIRGIYLGLVFFTLRTNSLLIMKRKYIEVYPIIFLMSKYVFHDMHI